MGMPAAPSPTLDTTLSQSPQNDSVIVVPRTLPSMAQLPAQPVASTMAPRNNTTTHSKSAQSLGKGAKKAEPLEPNVDQVCLGNIAIKTWYPSFYPEELVGRKTDRLFVCQWCFKYTIELISYLAHTNQCPLRSSPPPGTPIYHHNNLTIHEVDGSTEQLFCQNLSLFAKLFLDTKSVFYDVSTFLYYLLIAGVPDHTGVGNAGSTSRQVVGFFSKEKMSWDNNNLACILIFPPFQRHGYGQVLMGISYALSKRCGRKGGPEKPLSKLGQLSYSAYWSREIARYLLNGVKSRVKGTTTSVAEISDETYILPDDVIGVLEGMGVCERRRGKGVGVRKEAVREWVERNRISLDEIVHEDGFLEIEEDDDDIDDE